jgi:hypothetical protein
VKRADIGEHHRHLTAPLRIAGVPVELSQQRRDGGVDDLVRHDTPESLLRREGSFELLSIGLGSIVHQWSYCQGDACETVVEARQGVTRSPPSGHDVPAIEL